MKNSELKLKLINRGNEGELQVSGWIDANNAPEFQRLLEQQVERFDRIVLNLKDLEYISSAGLRALRVLHVKMRDKGERVVIKNVRDDVKSVFVVTGFNRLFAFEN